APDSSAKIVDAAPREGVRVRAGDRCEYCRVRQEQLLLRSCFRRLLRRAHSPPRHHRPTTASASAQPIASSRQPPPTQHSHFQAPTAADRAPTPADRAPTANLELPQPRIELPQPTWSFHNVDFASFFGWRGLRSECDGFGCAREGLFLAGSSSAPAVEASAAVVKAPAPLWKLQTRCGSSRAAWRSGEPTTMWSKVGDATSRASVSDRHR